MNRADAPLKQTAHSGRRSAERRHPGARLRTNGAAFAATNAEWRSARFARSEPRVKRPKAAGTSGHRSSRRATRMNGADAPLKQTAHSGRRSAERRHPGARPGTPNGALRVLRVQSREWSGRRPRERAASTAGKVPRGSIRQMHRSDKPLKQTAHSGRRSAERRHPVRGSEPTASRSRPRTPNGALRVLRVQSREWSGRRPRERAATAVIEGRRG